MKLCIGTSGWQYDYWKKLFYPENIPKKDWFSYFVTQFDTCEINATFYRWPKREWLLKWHDNAPKGFVYTFKSPRTITHDKRLKDVEKDIQSFYGLTSEVKDKLGCHLFQLPPSFKKKEETLQRLKLFLDALDNKKDNAIEFRDKSWWDDETKELLRKNRVAFCSVGGSEMPQDIVIDNELSYFRFHAKTDSNLFTKNELQKYADEILRVKPKKLYAYFDNDVDACATVNARMLKELLK